MTLIKEVEPEYTPEARAAGLQGSVVLYLEIGAAGEVETAHVIQSLGLGLDEKAIEAVKQRRYQPAILDGKPVEAEQSGEVRFLLDPPAPWRINRSGLNVDVAGVKKVNQLSKPLLKQYVSPAPEACPADGGFVIVSLKIDEDGVPGEVALEHPADAMGDAALKAIQAWRFQPGSLNGKPRAATAPTLGWSAGAATAVVLGGRPLRECLGSSCSTRAVNCVQGGSSILGGGPSGQGARNGNNCPGGRPFGSCRRHAGASQTGVRLG